MPELGRFWRKISLKKYIFIVLMLLSFISDAFCQVPDEDGINNMTEEDATKIIIESNESVIREIGKNSIKAKKICNYIKFHFLGFTYERDYNNYYDDKNQMTITSEILENGPILKLFNSEESAKQYMNEFCENLLNQLNIEIQQKEGQKKLLKESIRNYE